MCMALCCYALYYFQYKTGADVVIILKLNGVNFELFVVAKTGSK